jgi:hypothetical protein
VSEIRKVSEKREQGLKAFAGIRWMREQRRMELKFVFIVIGRTSKRFLFVKGVIQVNHDFYICKDIYFSKLIMILKNLQANPKSVETVLLML